MKKVLILIILITSSQFLIAQEKCKTESENLIELNTINKCKTTSYKKVDITKTRQLALKKTSSRIRFLKIKTKDNDATTLKKKNNQLDK